MMTTPPPRWHGLILAVVAAGSIGNALWMLAAPLNWYEQLPAAVPDYGPFNVHFVRDIGCAFLTVGLALGWAALVPSLRFPLTSVGLSFYGLHALVHVYDTGRGHVGAHHWLLDLPLVYLPAVLLLAVAVSSRRSGQPGLKGERRATE